MEKSLTNSQHSNFFIISSESSRNSPKHHINKQQYALFTKKVKKLLDTSGDDLEELYRKIQVIVTKYFNDNKIVQFKDMYEHISTLKSNNKRMDHIVNLLEKKMISQNFTQIRRQVTGQAKIKLQTEAIKQSKISKRSFKNEQFETTSGSQKQSNKEKNKGQYESPFFKNHHKIKDQIDQSNPLVITSLKENHIVSHQSSQQHNKIHINHQKQQQVEASQHQFSPNQLESNLDSYKTRNKQYQEKIKNLMQQLYLIKQMTAITVSNHQVNKTQNGGLGQTKGQDLNKFEIKEKIEINEDIKPQIRQKMQENTIENVTEVNHKQVVSIVKNKQNILRKASIQIKHKNMVILNEQILKNSHNNITQTQYMIPLVATEKNFHNNISIQNHLKPINNQNKQQQSQLVNLLKYTSNISKQIEQLQMVASKLQLESIEFISQKKIQQSQTQLITEEKIREIERKMEETVQRKEENVQQKEQKVEMKEEKKEKVERKAILDRIDNANSNFFITEDVIPSFKHLTENKSIYYNQNLINNENEKNNTLAKDDQTSNPLNHANSNSRSTSQLSINSHTFKIPLQEPNIPMQHNYNTIPYNQSPHQFQTVKYGYNPYEPLSLPPPAKTYIKYLQPLPNISTSVQYPYKSTQSHPVQSINSHPSFQIPSNNNHSSFQTQFNPISANNIGKSVITNRTSFNQVPIVSNINLNRSLNYTQHMVDPRVLQSHQTTLNNSLNSNLINSKSSQTNGSRSSSRQQMNRSSYVQNCNLNRVPVIMKSISSTRIGGGSQRIENGTNLRDQGPRMSDSAMKRKGIKVTSTK